MFFPLELVGHKELSLFLRKSLKNPYRVDLLIVTYRIVLLVGLVGAPQPADGELNSGTHAKLVGR